jgi:hypothetical protein
MEMIEAVNLTITDNTAPQGAAMFNRDTDPVTAANSILASTGIPSCAGQITSSGHNLATDDSCGFTAPGDVIQSNPRLDVLRNNGGSTPTHALLVGSQAIDGGGTQDCPTTDQRGASRPTDGDADGTAECDIGAYEGVCREGCGEPAPPSPTPAP